MLPVMVLPVMVLLASLCCTPHLDPRRERVCVQEEYESRCNEGRLHAQGQDQTPAHSGWAACAGCPRMRSRRLARAAAPGALAREGAPSSLVAVEG